MKLWLRAVLGTASLGTLAAAGFWLWFQSSIQQPLSIRQARLFEVQTGDSFQTIVKKLESEKILDDTIGFQLLAALKKSRGQLKAGEYRIQPGITVQALLSQLLKGRAVQYSLTFVEGRTVRQIMAQLAQHPNLTHTVSSQTDAEIMAALGSPESQHPEGWLFPDTYFFTKGDADRTLLKRAHRRMQWHLQQAWQKRDAGLSLKTPYEALILASIIEKETGHTSERRKISGVFHRRLVQGMRLQTDPTVIYGLGDAYDGDIRYRDLRADTPYNTYVHHGLPPTPIAIPGAAALHAAVHPEAGDSLYFVATGEGGHVFSATLKAHNRAVNRYQRRGGKH